MPKIFMYWENVPGQTRHGYIDLCEKTIRKHCKDDFDIVLITPDNLNDYLPGKDYSSITCFSGKPNEHISVKVGCIRVALLHKYGGIWIDIDTILMKSLVPIWELAKQHGFVGIDHKRPEKHWVLNTVLAAKRGSSIIEKYIVRLEDRLSKRQSLRWGEIGARMLTPLVRQSKDKYLLPEHSFLPISWEEWRLFFLEDAKISDHMKSDTYGFVLFNKFFTAEFKNKSEEEVLQSNNLIAKLFRRALIND